MVKTLVQTLCSFVITLFTRSGAIYDSISCSEHVQQFVSTWESNVKFKVMTVNYFSVNLFDHWVLSGWFQAN